MGNQTPTVIYLKYCNNCLYYKSLPILTSEEPKILNATVASIGDLNKKRMFFRMSENSIVAYFMQKEQHV